MTELVIYGAGGLAREVAFLAEEITAHAEGPEFEVLGFLSDDPGLHGTKVGKFEVLGGAEWFDGRHVPTACVIAIGTPKHIAAVSAKLKGRGDVIFPNLIHPGTIWDRDRIELGEGNIVTAGSIFTTDIRIGSYNVFNLGCTYGHDTVVGDCCVVNPGCSISGNVVMEGENLVGTGARVLQLLTLGRGATVGSGAVATKDVEPGDVVVGIPAKPLKR